MTKKAGGLVCGLIAVIGIIASILPAQAQLNILRDQGQTHSPRTGQQPARPATAQPPAASAGTGAVGTGKAASAVEQKSPSPLPKDIYIPSAQIKPVKGVGILDVISKNPQASKFTKLIKEADAAVLFQTAGQFTVFVPLDQAFSQLPAGTVEKWQKPENKDFVSQLLMRHVSMQTIDFPAMLSSGRAPVMGDLPVSLEAVQGKYYLLDHKARIVMAQKADNGMIYYIDQLMLPSFDQYHKDQDDFQAMRQEKIGQNQQAPGSATSALPPGQAVAPGAFQAVPAAKTAK